MLLNLIHTHKISHAKTMLTK